MRVIFLRTAVLQGKKQVTLELSLSGMDGNYTALTSDLAYDQNQITYNSHENGDVFDVLHINNARTRMIWEMSEGSVNKNGTAATLVFDVKDGVTGDIKIDVSSFITAYKEGNAGDPEDIDMAATSTSVTIAAPQPTTAPTKKPSSDKSDKSEKKVEAAPAATAVPVKASPKTADTEPLALYGAAAVLCAAALVVVRRRANH